MATKLIAQLIFTVVEGNNTVNITRDLKITIDASSEQVVQQLMRLKDKDLRSCFTGKAVAAPKQGIRDNTDLLNSILRLMGEFEVWESTPTKLLTVLCDNTPQHTKLDNPDWPRAANKLSIQLKQLKPILLKKGFKLTNFKSGNRVVTIRKVTDKEEIKRIRPDDDVLRDLAKQRLRNRDFVEMYGVTAITVSAWHRYTRKHLNIELYKFNNKKGRSKKQPPGDIEFKALADRKLTCIEIAKAYDIPISTVKSWNVHTEHKLGFSIFTELH